MALISDNHIIDPVTGLAMSAETGHAIGLVPPPIARVNHDDEWPRWVTPHESHIVRKTADGTPPSISVLGNFSEFHVNRVDGAVTVLVKNEDEEKEALAEAFTVSSEPEAVDPDDPPADADLID